jgi:hypothetical protein
MTGKFELVNEMTCQRKQRVENIIPARRRFMRHFFYMHMVELQGI